MPWSQEWKSVSELIRIAVRQKLPRGGAALELCVPIWFNWADLVLSLGRTRTLRATVPGLSLAERRLLVGSFARDVAAQLELFIDGSSVELCFTEKLDILADDERSSCAGKVGAALADLVMERMGFYWRANAREVNLRTNSKGVVTKKTPDFVYAPAGKHGFDAGSIVVVEAKGSLSKRRAKSAAVRNLAQSAFNDQVRPFVGAEASNLTVASGYAIAFGAVPGERTSTLAIASPQPFAFGLSRAVARAQPLSAATPHQVPAQTIIVPDSQQDRSWPEKAGPGGPGGPGGGGPGDEGGRSLPSGRIAYANYEAAFLLCGAHQAAAGLRTALNGEPVSSISEQADQEFFPIEVNGNQFLTGMSQDPFSLWLPAEARFAIYEPSATAVLRSLPNSPNGPPRELEIPGVPFGAIPFAGVFYPIHGDGLALLPGYLQAGPRRVWNIQKGTWA